MSQNLENQIQELLIKQNCPFCYKKVLKTNLAGFKHQKDFIFFLQKPICQGCWNKNSNLINTQNFSSLEQLKNTNQKLQNWIKGNKEKANQIQPKNSSQKEERTIYEDWEKKLSSS